MKKFFTLFAMMVMLALTTHAAYYLVGNEPFGKGWNPADGVELTDNGSGEYTFKATINGSIWFVMADGLAEAGDWTTFNNTLRIGPTNGDETIAAGQWISTQKSGGDHGAYKFTGTGEEYVITYIPAISKFMISGYVAPITIDAYTVAGTPAAVFGTEWDPSNTDNDMVKQDDGTYKLVKTNCELPAGVEFKYKVAANHDWGESWPAADVVVPVEESGIYNVTFTFDPSAEEPMPNCTMEKVGDTPDIPVNTGELFILGQANGNSWDPSVGVKMETEDQNIFTASITTDSENVEEDGVAYSYFSFTSKLAENSDDWSGIAPYRLGALENNYLLSEDQMGVEVPLAGFGNENSFKIANGEYDLTVNLEALTLVINKVETPEPPEPEEGYKIEKVWEINDLSFLTTADVRQGFGMGGKFYINCKTYATDSLGEVVTEPVVYVVDENGLTETTYPGGRNCGITRDEAGNLVVSNAAFPSAWVEATIKVINPETNEMKEYTVPEECGLLGRCDFLGFAKGDLMEDGVLYLTGGNTGTDPFTNGVAVMTIAGGEVSIDECYTASCDGLTGQTSTVINYYTDINNEEALVYAYRSAAPSKLMFDGENFVRTAIELPNKGHANGIFPFVWDGKELFIYPIMPDYQNGFAIAEAGAEEPIVEVPTTVAANANGYQADWLNAEIDKDGVTIYQYYPGGNITVYRLTNETGNVEEVINNENKVVAGVHYYNIMGQEMREANGITIIVTTYTDGSSSAVKVIK